MQRPRASQAGIAAMVVLATLAPKAARAEDDPPYAAELRELTRPVELTKHIFGSLEFGRGFRFNNPYRLATELGSGPQSVSLAAPYADLALGGLVGPPAGLLIGGSIHASFAMAGVPQAVLTPSFQLGYRGSQPFMAYGRVAPSIVLTPDPTVGAEVAGGFAWFVTGRLAVASELVFDLYYGAGTHHVAVASYPILSGQLGILVDWEVLP